MDDEAARVADVGQVGEELQRVDEPPARRATVAVGGAEAEREHRPGPPAEVLARQGVLRMILEPGVGHPGHPRVVAKEPRHAERVGGVALHAERQRLEALEQQEGVDRREARPGVAHRLGPHLHQEAVVAERIVEPQPVIRGRRVRDRRHVAVVEPAGLEHRPADAVAMSADELGGGVQHDGGAPVDGPAEVRRGECVVHDQRNAMRGGQRGQRLEVQNAAARIADRLAVEGSRRRRDRGLPVFQPGRVHEVDADRELAEGVGELGDRAAVEMRGGHDLVPGREQRHQRHELRRHAAGHGHRAGGVLQRRQSLLEDGGGRVADPGVDVAVLLELEELGGRLRVVEDVGGRLVDRYRAGADHRVGHVAGVQHARLEAELASARLGHVGYRLRRPASITNWAPVM